MPVITSICRETGLYPSRLLIPLSYASIWRNSLFVLGLFGLWHGASWSFVVWGLASGALIAVQHSWRVMRTRAGVRRAPRKRWGAGDWLSWAWTQSSAALFIVLFFSPDLAGAGEYYARLCDLSSFGTAQVPSSVWWVAAALALLYLGQLAVDRIGFARVEAAWQGLHPLLRLAGVLALAAATVQWRVAEPLPFVYFQF